MAVKSAVERLAERQAEIAERDAEIAEARAEQMLVDLEAIEALKSELGHSNVATEEIPFTPGLPVLVAACSPTPAQVKRYQDSLQKGRDGEEPDHIRAGREIGAACRKYPDDDTWAKVLEARPGVVVALGVAALRLAGAIRKTAGKG